MHLILGSSSTPRKNVLEQLKIPFEIISPEIDEVVKNGENVATFTSRLSIEKALAVKDKLCKPAVIIAGDQVLECEEKIFGKPLTEDNAKKQLEFLSERNACFYTSVCVLDTRNNHIQTVTCKTKLKFKKLDSNKINKYLELEEPYKCAGSFRIEGLGVCLIESIVSSEPYAILGMPILSITKMLQKVGITII